MKFIYISQVFFVTLLTSSLAEPPALSHSYGVPEISSGYSYEPTVSHAVGTDYIEQHVGHQTSEGIHLDSNLLHKIENVLVHHENSGSKIVSVPSSGYGVPQSSYGLPSHWHQSARVVGIDFGHLRQSIPVAQYLGQDRYAQHYNAGWSSANTGYETSYNTENSGWSSAGNSDYILPSKPTAWVQPKPSAWVQSKPSAWVQPAPYYIASSPAWSLAAPKPSGWTLARPSAKYGAPRW